jgi:hypothetical protein
VELLGDVPDDVVANDPRAHKETVIEY